MNCWEVVEIFGRDKICNRLSIVKLKILILSDSLAAPRKSEKDNVTYSDLWVGKICNTYQSAKIFHVPIGHATSDVLLAQCKYWQPEDPDCVFFQCGLNDALPRVLKKYEAEFCAHHKILGRALQILLKRRAKKSLRNLRNITYVKPDLFQSNLQFMKDSFERAFFLGITSSNVLSYRNSLSAKQNIEQYNAIAENVFGANFIDLKDLKDSCFGEDKFHLSKKGHSEVARKVEILVNNLLPEFNEV